MPLCHRINLLHPLVPNHKCLAFKIVRKENPIKSNELHDIPF